MELQFHNDIEKRNLNISNLNKTSSIVTFFKVILFILICYNSYNVYIYNYPSKLLLLLFIEVILFVIACIYHRVIHKRIKKQEGIIKIDEKNLSRIEGNWYEFTDIGEEFINYDHDYATDLDIVGKNSLFQMINSTGTYYGRNKFAKDLLSPNFSQEDLKKRQEAIAELSNNYDFCANAEYDFSLIGIDSKFTNLISQLQDKKIFIKSKFLIFFFKVSSFLTCLSLIYSLISKNPISMAITQCFIIFQILLWIIGYLKSNRYVGFMNELSFKIRLYDDILDNISNTNFTCDKLVEIKKNLKEAKIGISKLSKIGNNISQRNNSIMCIIFNSLLLWDYKNAIDLDYWKRKYHNKVENWFYNLGELESLISFANLPRVCNNLCIPIFNDGQHSFKSTNLGHPLINNSNRICNDFNLNENIYIISGSNMSGKTTFMRTIGINMVLAYAGSYVCANSLSLSNMKLVTSMRIRDDLNDGISTFYAELKRIKKIVDLAHSNSNTLFLIDEIFRGTNSVDRLKGAEGVLKELSKLNTSGMITTHDLEVCNLENEYSNIVNCSFNEHYKDNEIYFDYKLKKGKSLTTNAEYLLKKVGILS